MRKNSPRKWLHACLDLLPVILIPVFMIYSHRHDVTETTTINYKYQSNEVNTLDDLIVGNIYLYDYFEITSNNVNSDGLIFTLQVVSADSISITSSNLHASSFDLTNLNNKNCNIDFYFENNTLYLYPNFNSGYIELGYLYTEVQFTNAIIQVNDNNELFDFKTYLTDYYGIIPQYTDYNVIESVDFENTDVMDSFMNHFNNTIDNHFNMGNVFNLNGVYQWLNTNIFNGNAPQVIYSVWNIALYELVMDLLFLLYGLFMWFIDMVQHLMDKPFKSIK